MKLKLFPYKMGSESARVLARRLGIKRVYPTYNPRRTDVIINWGNSNPVHYPRTDLDLNKHEAIAIACNKLKTFQHLESKDFKQLPIWTFNRQEAYELMGVHNTSVYCRQTVTGHSGRGIVIADNAYDMIDAPLYTLATKHKHEYRVHVFKGKVIDVQQKRKRIGAIGNGIRNHGNGWVYARAEVTPSEELLSSACKAVNLLGLDFGAVDIGHRLRDNKFFVFEINTAPGLTGTTLDKYAQAFTNYLRSL